MLAFFVVNKLKDSGKNNPGEKVGNYREDCGKGLVSTIVCGRNETGTFLCLLGRRAGVTTPAISQGFITGVLSGPINPEASVLTYFSKTRDVLKITAVH